MSATPTPLPFRPFRLRGNTRFRKTRHSANRPPRQRRSRPAATRRVVLLGPFGEPLITPSGLAAEMPFRSSTKYQDAETGLYSYIFRPYDPLTGRWLSRDPINEHGFKILILNGEDWNHDESDNDIDVDEERNLYLFVKNEPTTFTDWNGLKLQVCTVRSFGGIGRHAFVRDTETNDEWGMHGCLGIANKKKLKDSQGNVVKDTKGKPIRVPDDGGAGGRAVSPCNCRDVNLPCGMTPAEGMRKIKSYPSWQSGIWAPAINDCHNQLERAFEYAKIPYPGAAQGRVSDFHTCCKDAGSK